MSLLEELFGVDEAEEAEALERIIEGGSEHDEDPPGDPEDEAVEDKRTVDPSKPKNVRKHPNVVLNAVRLTGPRGLQVLPEHFKEFKPKGKGHEKEDLDIILKKLEHWAHRLYPKYQFDDSLKKIEYIGNKRAVMVMLRKIRSDQLISDELVQQRDSSDDEAAPVDEFDILLQQQVDAVRATPIQARTPALAPKATSSPSINEEQKMRMLRNKQLAEERRKNKMTNDTNQNDNQSDSDRVESNSDTIDLTGVTLLGNIDLTTDTSKNKTNIDITSNVNNSEDIVNIDLTNTETIPNNITTEENLEIDLTINENKTQNTSDISLIDELSRSNEEKDDDMLMDTELNRVPEKRTNHVDIVDNITSHTVRTNDFSSDESSDGEMPTMNVTVADIHNDATQHSVDNSDSLIQKISDKNQIYDDDRIDEMFTDDF